MAQEALATKYRPLIFEEVVSQDIIIDILREQLATGTFKHAYLFCGPAGCGKTTIARILAKEVNKGIGTPIEVDAASNNGVDNVRTIIDECYKKPIIGEYKVYILDEVHMLSTGAWNALLKLLEEPPKSAIFIMCTTDPQKIPNTILSRVQRFDFSRIPYDGIKDRLWEINMEESLALDIDVISYVAKLSDGGLRNAISMLDKIRHLPDPNNLEEVSNALSYVSYEDMFSLMHDMINGFKGECIKILDRLYKNGVDIKRVVTEFNHFLIDVCKVKLFNTMEYSKIPKDEKYAESIREEEYEDVLKLLDWCQKLLYNIKWETNVLRFVEAEILVYGLVD